MLMKITRLIYLMIGAHLVEFDRAEDVNPLREQLVNVTQQVGIHGSTASKRHTLLNQSDYVIIGNYNKRSELHQRSKKGRQDNYSWYD